MPRAADPADQICIENRAAGPGGCVRPTPESLPSLGALWRLFRLTHFADMRNPWDGVLLGRDMRQVQAVAEAIGEPWDTQLIERFTAILDAYVEDYHKRVAK